jgi:hypothetical protein
MIMSDDGERLMWFKDVGKKDPALRLATEEEVLALAAAIIARREASS